MSYDIFLSQIKEATINNNAQLIFGDWWKPNGKSIDEWVKEFFTWMFGGFQ